MMDMKHGIAFGVLLGVGLLVAGNVIAGPIAGSFIQLNRLQAEKSTEEWQREFRKIQELGGRTLIVQWAAEDRMLYFRPAGESPFAATEIHPVIETILSVAEAENMEVFLGLLHQQEYWEQITGRDEVIKEFFLIRMARNARLHAALLETFGDRQGWVGTYIPDEIDDRTWRTPDRQHRMQAYLEGMTAILRRNDPERAIAVSAFFRGRTSPEVVARNFRDLTAGADLDYVLIQDGIGTGDPPLRYAPIYYAILTAAWRAADADAGLPELWAVIEAFEQTSAGDEPFAAKPAPPERLIGQLRAARDFFPRLILFTFSDYMDPRLGPDAEAVFQAVREFDPGQ